ncbi:CatA-like O-acetyltransferase [Mucilaginibacter sp.]
MKTKLDLNTWAHREHFNLFNGFTEPMFGFTVDVDCTVAYNRAKELGISFFLYYLYQSMAAVNAIEPFRYRIENHNEVFVHDVANAESTILRDNGTFGFVYLKFYPTLQEFVEAAQTRIERIKQSSSLFDDETSEDVIHYSTIPWFKFTALTHARNYSRNDGIPKITFGKVTESNGQKTFPVSITVHHGLMDGLQVGQYVELFQQLLNS